MQIVKILVSHCCREFLCAVDHLLNLLCYRNAANEMLLLVNLEHLGSKILSIAMTKLLDSINASSLEKLCELRANTLYAEKVSMVAPFENELARDSCLLLKSLAASWSSTFSKKLSCCIETCSCKFFSISSAYAFDVDNFVSHSILI